MSKTASAQRLRRPQMPPARARLEGLAQLPGTGPIRASRLDYVPRPELVARLTGAEASVAVIAAPAGYGKTTLAREWAACDARPFAWVAVDNEHDACASVFVGAVEEALDEVAPVREARRGTSTRSRRGPAAVALARVVRSLASRPPFVLLLDDVQGLRASASLEAMRTLARHVPTASTLALCSRTEPALPIGRLRANRALTEIRASDLAMTTAEAKALLDRAGLKLSTADAELLAKKTEGWPAGIYLASVAVRGARDRRAAIARFGGDDEIVSEYLRDEVLSQVPPESVRFLMRASVLERLSGPVCDAVLERSDSAELLSSIGRAELLLVPLDRRADSYRCHDLIAGMLRAELRRSDPDQEVRQHRRASDWYAERGEVDRAMHHAVAAGDSSRAADLLAANAPEYVTQSRNGTMERWLGSFAPEQIAGHPALSLAAANSELLKGNLVAVQRWASAARRMLDDTAPAERSPALEATVALLHAAVARHGLVRMGADAARAYDLEPEDSPWRPICCLVEGVSLHLTGDDLTAEVRLLEGVRRATVAAPNIQTLCLAQLASMTARRHDLERAAGFSERASAQVEHYALRAYPTSALVFAVSAEIRARRGRVEEAQRDADEAHRLLGMLTDFIPWYEVETRLALASAAVRLGDVPRAREMVGAAEPLACHMAGAVVLDEWIERVRDQVAAASSAPALLTTAELRILGFLPTHLSFREIAEHLYVSANTVKTQAHAVYRKLDAVSRSEAVTRATQLGLLGL